MIPTSIANKIIGMVKEISPLYQRATHYNVGGNLTIPSYDESTQKITMAYATEFTALTSTSGKFTSISLSGFLAGALTKVSISLVNNSKFDIVSYVIRKMAEAVAEWIENELINGTASKIEGLSKVTASVTAAAATAVTADELIDLQESIPDALQANCIWVMSRATRKAIRKLKDADGNYLLNKDLTAKWGYSLLGRDVYVSQSMPDMAAFARLIVEKAEYDELSDAEKQGCAMALEAAKSYVAGYTGLDIETTELEDIAYAVLVIATEMLDNRQMTAQYTGQNPTAMQILNMHSTNLLPTVSDLDTSGAGEV